MAQWCATKGYVEDVGAAIALAAVSDRAAGRTYNVGDADTLTVLEWAERISRTMNWRGEFKLLPDDRLPPHLRTPGNTSQHWIADTTRIRDEVGFREAGASRRGHPSNRRVAAGEPAHRHQPAPGSTAQPLRTKVSMSNRPYKACPRPKYCDRAARASRTGVDTRRHR